MQIPLSSVSDQGLGRETAFERKQSVGPQNWASPCVRPAKFGFSMGLWAGLRAWYGKTSITAVSLGSSPLRAKRLSEEAQRGEGTGVAPRELALSVLVEKCSVYRLVLYCLIICFSGCEVVPVVPLQQQQQLNQSHSFTWGMNEWPHSVRNKCMLVCCRALLVAFCHHEKCCRAIFLKKK